MMHTHVHDVSLEVARPGTTKRAHSRLIHTQHKISLNAPPFVRLAEFMTTLQAWFQHLSTRLVRQNPKRAFRPSLVGIRDLQSSNGYIRHARKVSTHKNTFSQKKHTRAPPDPIYYKYKHKQQLSPHASPSYRCIPPKRGRHQASSQIAPTRKHEYFNPTRQSRGCTTLKRNKFLTAGTSFFASIND